MLSISTALSIMKDTKIYKTWLLELNFIHMAFTMYTWEDKATYVKLSGKN